jgi:hypothetical protein
LAGEGQCHLSEPELEEPIAASRLEIVIVLGSGAGDRVYLPSVEAEPLVRSTALRLDWRRRAAVDRDARGNGAANRNRRGIAGHQFGRLIGSKAFSRGALYLMLQNRLYRGEVVHKRQSHPGEHTPIIDPPNSS